MPVQASLTKSDSWPSDSEDLSAGRRNSPWLFSAGLMVILVVSVVVVFALHKVVVSLNESHVDSRYAPSRQIRLDEPDVPSDAGSNGEAAESLELRVAIAPVISPEKSLPLYRGFVDYLAEELGRSPSFLQGDTYAEVNDLVRYGRCDVAFVCTYAFVRGEREFGMRVLVVPEIGGVTTYHSLILVPASSKATSLLDLRGKRFGSADILSNSGWLYPVTWLRDHGENADEFFGKHELTGSHDMSVTAVASGFVDGAAVDSLVYEQMVAEDPAIASRTKVILKSPPFGMPPVVTPAGIDPTLREQLLKTLLEMHASPGGQAALESVGIDRFVVPDEHLFDSVREASKLLERR